MGLSSDLTDDSLIKRLERMGGSLKVIIKILDGLRTVNRRFF